MALSVFLSAFVAAGFQYEAQAVIPAANAQPFLALQPIFSAAWAYVLLGEPVAPSALAGGVVQIGGALIASNDDTVRAAGGEKKPK
jgi:drug/metabolite transporter (DMT)-like permease